MERRRPHRPGFSGRGLGASEQCQVATISTVPSSPAAPISLFSEAFVGAWSNAGQIKYESMAVDGQGNIIVAGSFSGQISFGGGNIVSHGGVDIFIAKYDASGAYRWSEGFGGTADDWEKAVAVDTAGNIIITSWSASGSVDFGGGAIPLTSGYLAKYGPDGRYLWARMLSTGISDGTALATELRPATSSWAVPSQARAISAEAPSSVSRAEDAFLA